MPPHHEAAPPFHHHHPPPPPGHFPPASPHHPPPPFMAPPTIGGILDPSSSTPLHAKEKTPMCLVNELARFNKVQHQYRLTDESGPAHKKTFTVCLKIGDTEEYVASGPSIKKAQHAAAAISLEKTQFKHPSPKSRNVKNANITPTVELNALAMKRGEPTTYTFLEQSQVRQSYSHQYSNARQSGYPPMFYVQLRVGNRDFSGEGPTAQAAKHNAAGKALKMLNEIPMPDGKSKLDPTSQPFTPGIEYDDLKSPISLVHEIALKRNFQVYFEVIREAGPPHMRSFLTKCIVGEFLTEGDGNGKKVSKKRAAELMLDKLKQLPPVVSALVPKPRKMMTTKKKSRNLIKLENTEGPGPGVVAGAESQSINPISRLIQIQQARKEKEPVYSLVAERGMPRRREFVMQVTVGQQSATGSGPNKKLAKRAAAEALLQLLGYSRPGPQPSKPALRSPGEGGGEKGRKLTFVDEVNNGSVSNGGRQLVPGLLYIDDKAPKYKTPPIVSGAPAGSQQQQQQQVNGTCNGHPANGHGGQAATIAAELLRAGTSPTAEALVVPQNMPQLPPQGQGVSPKEQLAYLSQVLGFSVSYTDFPKKGEYLSLVSLSTNPPQVSHGAGATLEGSHNNAAHTALKTLASNGLDTVVENGQGKGPHH